MSTVIITNTSDNIKGLSDITLPNKAGYAEKHGYELLCYEFDYQNYNNVVIDSMKAVLDVMRCSDVVMTMGADTMFTNWNIRIKDVLFPADRVVIAREKTTWWPINDDVMIWRCTPEVIAFYERLIDDFPIWSKYQWRLQMHLWNLLQEEPGVKELITVVEPEIMNQHPTKWQLGNWIIHMYNMSIDDKINQAREIMIGWPDGNPVWKQQVSDVRPGVI